jgi:hypothetical protein
LVALAIALLPGCEGACIRQIVLRVNPPDARVVDLDDDGKPVIPGKPGLAGDKDHTLVVSAPGYPQREVKIRSETDKSVVTLYVIECILAPIVAIPVLIAIAGTQPWKMLEPGFVDVDLTQPSDSERTPPEIAVPAASSSTSQSEPPKPDRASRAASSESATPPSTAPVVAPSPSSSSGTAQPLPEPTPAPTGIARPKYCRECGNQFRADDKFCRDCGAKR